MTLEEFKRTRVEMTLEQYQSTYDGDFVDTEDETAKMHVYKNGLYLRELLNGFYCSDTGDETRFKILDMAENSFWTSFADLTYNPKPKRMLSKETQDRMLLLRHSAMVLCSHWLNSDNDINDLIGEDYPKELPDFESLSNLIDKWVMTAINKL